MDSAVRRALADRWLQDPFDGGFRSAGSVSATSPDEDGFHERSEYERYVRDLRWLRGAVGFERYEGQRVLEVGFGTGVDLLSFRRRGAQVYGVDLTLGQAILATDRFRQAGHQASSCTGEGATLPFGDDCFDLVYLFDVLGYQQAPREMLAEVQRVVRDGGEVLIVEPEASRPTPSARLHRAWLKVAAGTPVEEQTRGALREAVRLVRLILACSIFAPLALLAVVIWWPIDSLRARSVLGVRKSPWDLFSKIAVERYPWARLYRLKS